MIFLRFSKYKCVIYQHISLLFLLLKVVSVPLECGIFSFLGGFYMHPTTFSHRFSAFLTVTFFQGKASGLCCRLRMLVALRTLQG